MIWVEITKWVITTIIGILGIFIGRRWVLNDKRNNKDKVTIGKFHEFFPKNKMIDFREYNFAQAVPYEMVDFLFDFRDRKSNYPDFIFLDKELENLRIEFINSIEDFLNYLHPDSTWPILEKHNH